MTPFHAAALEYAESRGWYVFPLQPGTKIPFKGTSGHLQASKDPHQIAQWWSQTPDANVGIAVKPSKLVVLDIDVNGAKQGRESLVELDSQLPDTLTALTGRGGLHIIYTAPSDMEVPRIIGFKPGLDLLGDGYIVAAPSVLEGGSAYRWNRVTVPAALPPVLRQARPAVKPQKQKTEELAPLAEGGRNMAIFRLGAALRDQGIGREALYAALHHENAQRCKPPLPDEELRQIVHSVLQRVAPTRDVAAGAVDAAEVKEIFAPDRERAKWIGDVSKTDAPPMRFYPTSFPKLNELLGGGLATRQVFGLIGPPSSGKSGLVNELVLDMQKHLPVLHVSSELPCDELHVRYAAGQLEFAWRDGMKGIIPRQAMHDAVAPLRIKLLGCDDIDRVDPIGCIRNEALKMREQFGIAPAIALDYVQLLARGSADQVRSKVGELSMQLRMLAQELDTVIIAVFSTGRAFYGGQGLEKLRAAEDPTAFLVAAKESGDIEFDCATIVYLDLDKLHEGLPKPGRMAVARCRVGDIGFVGVQGRLDVGRWYEDANAIAALSAENRGAKQAEQTLTNDCTRLLDLIRRMPKRPWREIKTAAGANYQRMDAARAKLLEDGIIEQVREEFYDGSSKLQRRDILRERNAVPPAGVAA
jgi:putative DNA primase/helicase